MYVNVSVHKYPDIHKVLQYDNIIYNIYPGTKISCIHVYTYTSIKIISTLFILVYVYMYTCIHDILLTFTQCVSGVDLILLIVILQ